MLAAYYARRYITSIAATHRSDRVPSDRAAHRHADQRRCRVNRCVVGVSPGIVGVGLDDGANSVDHLGLNSLEPSMCFQKKCVAHIDAFNVARWVPYPARTKRSGAVLGAQSTDEVGPTKSRKGPIPQHRGPVLWHSTKEKTMSVQYPPLHEETRPTVPTAQAAYYLNRKPQTLRGWACKGDGPITPIHIGVHLAWRLADIRALVGA